MEPDAILKNLLEKLGMAHAEIAKSEVAGQPMYNVRVEGVSGGMTGDFAHALDVLVKKIYEGRTAPETDTVASQPPPFFVDVNEFRTKQIKDLQAKALMMAERARSFQYDVELSPMTAYERLIVHTTLHDAPHVKTESQGEGRNRRVVIKYAAE